MTNCTNCKTEISNHESICSYCKYPINGSEKEQSIFIANQVMQKGEVKASVDRIKKIRILLYIVGGFYFVVPFLFSPMSSPAIVQWFNLLIGVVFIAFGFVINKKPVLGISAPFALILLYYMLLFVLNPLYIVAGIAWKIAVVLALTYGLIGIYRSNKILKNNRFLADELGAAS